jgi:hypothetical protein
MNDVEKPPESEVAKDQSPSVEITLEGDFFIAKYADGHQTIIAKNEADDRVQYYIPFSKVDKTDKDVRYLEGWATTGSVDGADEIVDLPATEEALPDYAKYGNIREMHQPKAVGVAVELRFEKSKGLWLKAKVVDAEAIKKIDEGVYKGFSIGGRALEKVSRFIKALGRNISVITKLKLIEISIVDRPCNPDCNFAVAKLDEVEADSTSKGEGFMESLRKMGEALGLVQSRAKTIAKHMGGVRSRLQI